jgi:hypothetical protein
MNDGSPVSLLKTVSLPAAKGSVLRSLVAPETIERFLREFWPEQVFHTHGPLSRLPALFTSSELSSFHALASQYRGPLGFGRGAVSPRMITMQETNPAHLYELGLSVYLPDIESTVPGAEPFLRALERDLGLEEFSCHITVWASPRADGASVHFDAEDVISVQLAGTKQFEVAPMKEHAFPFGMQFGPGAAPFNEMYPQLENGFPDPERAEFQTVEMKPGSVLYVPRGTWHRTRAEQDSFAISIGIRPPCVIDAFLDQLRYLLLQDPELRRPLYGARGDAKQRQDAMERAQKALQSAQAAVRAISPADLARPPEPERLKNVQRSTRFQRDLGTRIDFEEGARGEFLQVKAWSQSAGLQDTLKMNVPPQYSKTFRWLAESTVAFSAGELADRFPEVPFEQHQKILDVLTRARYLRLLWFPQLPKQ